MSADSYYLHFVKVLPKVLPAELSVNRVGPYILEFFSWKIEVSCLLFLELVKVSQIKGKGTKSGERLYSGRY